MNIQNRDSRSRSTWDWEAALSAGRLAKQSGDPDRALDRFREAVRLAEIENDAQGISETLNSLGVTLSGEGRFQDAIDTFQRAIASGSEHPEARIPVAVARINLAELLVRRGQSSDAEQLLRAAAPEIDARTKPAEWSALMNNLGNALTQENRLDEALEVYSAALDHAQASFGEDHPLVIILRWNAAAALTNSGNTQKGADLLREAVSSAERTFGPDSEKTRMLRAELSQL